MLGKSQTSASSSGFHPFLFWTSSFLFLGSVFLPFRLLNSQTFYQSFLIFPFFVPDDPLFEEDIPLQKMIVMIQNYHSEGVCHSRFSLPMLFHRSKGRHPEKKLLFSWILSKSPPPCFVGHVYNLKNSLKFKLLAFWRK